MINKEQLLNPRSVSLIVHSTIIKTIKCLQS